MNVRSSRTAALAIAIISVAGLAACSDSDDAAGGSGSGDVVQITVADLPPSTEEARREQFLDKVAAFEAENPDIDIEPAEGKWEANTFAARLASGELETVFRVPLTEPQALIARGQVADITDEAADLPHFDTVDERALAPVQDESGRLFGIPTDLYAMGLLYNRELFTQAGLDPDDPPATWDDVRAAARQIAERTGVPGFAFPTINNTGGWVFTSMVYSFGGRLQDDDGDEVSSTLTDDPAVEALELLKAMRWDDQSMGTQHLSEALEVVKAFAAGQVGMVIGLPSQYRDYAVQYSGSPEAFGVTALPTGSEPSTLLSGAVMMVSPKASDEQRAAAVKWIDFNYLRSKHDADIAGEGAAAQAADGLPVGIPKVPFYGDEVVAAVLAAESGHVNVPLENFQPFVDRLEGQEFVPEPRVAAQEVYGALDSALQAVLTQQDADPAAELAAADDKARAAIDRAQR
ncbi:extracellular solute-binding protein [Jiangella aurantiaca]|uniref:Extracellular solute-binding protein n=1 Tax=Jiangella aurantiaca TaxID=2530373 RepID=A0A4V2YT68_9ACTN|nr:extracellular solute-binding protein [Jiangella aurantiaca]TDD72677.1 extracellular solute-binding protein [Jiangella aurantiaca]